MGSLFNSLFIHESPKLGVDLGYPNVSWVLWFDLLLLAKDKPVASRPGAKRVAIVDLEQSSIKSPPLIVEVIGLCVQPRLSVCGAKELDTDKPVSVNGIWTPARVVSVRPFAIQPDIPYLNPGMFPEHPMF